MPSARSGGLGRPWPARPSRRNHRARPVQPEPVPRQCARLAQDDLALLLCKDGLALGQDKGLSEAERIFFYLPLEHSEAPEDQDASVAKFTDLLVESREGFRSLVENTLQYAKAHKDVIDQFGRFPHRNKALGRESTEAEKEWLAEGGGF